MKIVDWNNVNRSFDQMEICDRFMPASESRTVSDVHGLKLASHCECDPGIKFWQVLARRVRHACKHESRVTLLLMVGQEHREHENSGKNTRLFEARAGELEDPSWIVEDRKCVTVCDSVVGVARGIVGRRSCRATTITL
jgi:hypothetical protein